MSTADAWSATGIKEQSVRSGLKIVSNIERSSSTAASLKLLA